MIEKLIPRLPNEFTKIYEKIYIQVYEQQLKYQKKLEKQQFLMSLMEQFIKGEKQKIDC